MNVFAHAEFDAHEQVCFCHDAASGLRAIIAIHNTALGPALGGVRMWPYANEADALADVLRLSRGMTYKSALAGLQLGGGKSVIIGDPARDKSRELMIAMGEAVDALGGRYIAAEDSGTTVEDLKAMRDVTRHVAGIADKPTAQGGMRTGDPSPATAYGVYAGIRAAVAFRLQRDDLDGVRVAVQGVGSVGFKLAKRLAAQGARLWLTDIDTDRARLACGEVNATLVRPEEIFALDVDVFAPCAMGAVINDDTAAKLRARIVAGAANNQLAQTRHADALAERGILYAPDYVINAGGVIDVALELDAFDVDAVNERVAAIGATLTEIFERAEREGRNTSEVADRLAREKFQGKRDLRESVVTGT
jgi:leucine dehydrogenase